MLWANFRFYADLNDFLPKKWRQRSFRYPVQDGSQSVKHLIEAIGIPHTEIDLILVNGHAIEFNYLVQDGDQVSVYPPFTSNDLHPPLILRPQIMSPVRFLLDNHLGRLARYLRLLGFDTLYFNNLYADEQLASIAHETGRILLTRDRGLLMRKKVTYGYCLRTKDSKKQLQSVINRYQLKKQIKPWQRCLRCNGHLQFVEKEKIWDFLEPKTKKYFNEFQQCQDCQQVYWKGSHYTKLEQIIVHMVNSVP